MWLEDPDPLKIGRRGQRMFWSPKTPKTSYSFHWKLLLDNSASFTSWRMKDLCQKWKVSHHTVSRRPKQYDGLTWLTPYFGTDPRHCLTALLWSFHTILVRACAVLRSPVDRSDAGQISTGLHLPASCEASSSSRVHVHPDRLLRRHVDHQERQKHFHHLPAHGNTLRPPRRCFE